VNDFERNGYAEAAIRRAVYEELEDGMFAGRIPGCTGVVAFGETWTKCDQELRSTLDDWILVGMKLKHLLPVID
jgi:predicted RNase H-like HicB family nuclease